MHKKVMYKVSNKDNVFRIRDFTSSDNIDISKFVEGENSRGAPQMQAQVYVLFEDEYNSIIEELEPLRKEVQHLKRDLNDKQIEIKRLEKQIKEKGQSNNDEVMQLKEEQYNITQKHNTEVRKLHRKISDLEKSHLEYVEELKQTQSNQLLDIHEKHNNEIETLTNQYESKLDEVNNKLLSEVQANKRSSEDFQEQILAMTQTHDKKVSQIHQGLKDLEIEHSNEILELTKAHQSEINVIKEEFSQSKQEHLKEINKLEHSHNDEREKIRNTFLNLLMNENKEDIRQLIDLSDNLPSIFKPFMRKHLKAIDEMKEKKQINTPESIIKTYEISGEKEK